MKIIHTADWHIGRRIHEVDLREDLEKFFEFLISTAQAEAVAAVLVSGDIYDRSMPAEESVSFLQNVLKRLTAFTQVVLISGNHDSAPRLGFGAPFFNDRLHIITSELAANQIIELTNEKGQAICAIATLPYLDPYLTRYSLANALLENDLSPDNPDSQAAVSSLNKDLIPLECSHQAVVSAGLKIVSSGLHQAYQKRGFYIPEILMAHEFVTGAKISESERDISVGGVQEVSAELFCIPGSISDKKTDAPQSHSLLTRLPSAGRLSYVALGHIHGRQKVGSAHTPPIYYSGSPVKFSFSEEKHQKSIILLEFPTLEMGNTKENSLPHTHSPENPVYPQISYIPIPLLQDLKTITASFADLLTETNVEKWKDYRLRFILTDQEMQDYSELYRLYSHLLSISTPNLVSEIPELINSSADSPTYSPIDLTIDFYRSNHLNLKPAELKLIEELISEITREAQ